MKLRAEGVALDESFLVNLKKQNGPATHLTLLHKGRL